MNSDLNSAVLSSASQLEIEPEVLMAVIEIESAGKIFALVNGKNEPLIRFEGHYFDKRLRGSARMRARLRGLASPIAGHISNPAKQQDRWILLEKAMYIDHQAALESTSWGIGQVMGAHWRWLGYDSVDQMVEVARSGVGGQVQLIERYIQKSGLVAPLRALNWTAFARGYNGPAYAKFGYHTKLAKAYARLRVIKPVSVPPVPKSADTDILRLGSSGQKVADLQHQLTAAGYPVIASSTFDLITETALRSFQRENNLLVDGLFGPQTAVALSKKMPSFSLWSLLMVALRWFGLLGSKPIL